MVAVLAQPTPSIAFPPMPASVSDHGPDDDPPPAAAAIRAYKRRHDGDDSEASHLLSAAYLLYRDRIARRAVRLLQSWDLRCDPADGEDVAQETFVRVVAHVRAHPAYDLPASAEGLGKLLFTIARNACYDRLRSLRRIQVELGSSERLGWLQVSLDAPTYDKTGERDVLPLADLLAGPDLTLPSPDGRLAERVAQERRARVAQERRARVARTLAAMPRAMATPLALRDLCGWELPVIAAATGVRREGNILASLLGLARTKFYALWRCEDETGIPLEPWEDRRRGGRQPAIGREALNALYHRATAPLRLEITDVDGFAA